MIIRPPLTVTLGELAAQRPASIPVFERLGLDCCCRGQRTPDAAVTTERAFP
jgi:iron-sulfur cluster repair protein YtfE (RIC family)